MLLEWLKGRYVEEKRGGKHAEYGVLLWEYKREKASRKNTTYNRYVIPMRMLNICLDKIV